MKAPSPFLPDVATLSSLFAAARVCAEDRSRLASAMPAVASPGAATPFRFPAVALGSAPPSKGVARVAPATRAEPTGQGTTVPMPMAVARTRTRPMPTGSTASASARPTTERATIPPLPVPSSVSNVDSISHEAAMRAIFGPADRQALPLQQRLDAFVEWLGVGIGAIASFIADADGLVLTNHHAPENYIVATASLSFAEQAVHGYMPRPPEGSTTMELDDANFLQVIRVDTAGGRLVIGLIVTAALNRNTCATIRRLLRAGVEWEVTS